MNKTLKLFIKELQLYLKKEFGQRCFFCLIYGSYCYGLNNPKSDVDLVVVLDSVSKKEIKLFSGFVIGLHKKFDLLIDNEVPHDLKTITSIDILEKSIDGRGFAIQNNRLVIPKIKKTKSFLCSKQIGMRLLLNALTSKSLFVYGDVNKYFYFKRRACETIIKVILSHYKIIEFSLNNFLDLIFYQNYLTGEEYLGYKDVSVIRKYQKGQFREMLDGLVKKGILKKNNNIFKLINKEWLHETF